MATTVPETSSAIIDERRAQQMMERAMNLAERNDLASAVLACRQAIALSPQTAQSYSMLGLLLERAEDTSGAVAAYEKVLELAPDSFLERESLSRLRGAASQRRNAREMFAFDDNELFGEDSAQLLPKTSAAEAGSTPSTKTARETPSNAAAPAAPGAPQAAAETTAPQNKASGAVPAATASAARGAGSTPSATSVAIPSAAAKANAAAANRPGSSASGAMPFPSTQAPRSPQPGLGVPLEFATPTPRLAKQSAWQRLKQRPTPYFRGVPLAGATAISLLFLLWANNYASSNRAADAPSPAPFVAADPFSPPEPEVPKPGVSPANPALTNQPANSSPIPTNPATTSAPVNPGTPAASGVPTNPGAPAPSGVPTNPAAPASPAPTGTGSTPGAPSSTVPPRAAPAVPAPAPAQGVAPSDSGGASSNGNPLGPTGAPAKDYTRVTPAGGSPVARPENRAATDERNARSDAQAGRSNSAIDNLSRAIESGGPDVALRYQQRAQLYLQSNDGARASSDFQAAISAYNDMIARGDRVAIARSGISACRRGLQMAQARR